MSMAATVGFPPIGNDVNKINLPHDKRKSVETDKNDLSHVTKRVNNFNLKDEVKLENEESDDKKDSNNKQHFNSGDKRFENNDTIFFSTFDVPKILNRKNDIQSDVSKILCNDSVDSVRSTESTESSRSTLFNGSLESNRSNGSSESKKSNGSSESKKSNGSLESNKSNGSLETSESMTSSESSNSLNTSSFKAKNCFGSSEGEISNCESLSSVKLAPSNDSGRNQFSLTPACQNCQTSTTPLWRRDEAGQVLCNACGLFLKLHGRARPISLKTNVIKSRNRIKNHGHGSIHHTQHHNIHMGFQQLPLCISQHPHPNICTTQSCPIQPPPPGLIHMLPPHAHSHPPPPLHLYAPPYAHVNPEDDKCEEMHLKDVSPSGQLNPHTMTHSHAYHTLPYTLPLPQNGSSRFCSHSQTKQPTQTNQPISGTQSSSAHLTPNQAIPRSPALLTRSTITHGQVSQPITQPLSHSFSRPTSRMDSDSHNQALLQSNDSKPHTSLSSNTLHNALDQLSTAASQSSYIVDTQLVSNDLRTRLSELELVNDLFRSRVAEMEASEQLARRSEASMRESEMMLRSVLYRLENRVKALEAKNVRLKERLATAGLSDDDSDSVVEEADISIPAPQITSTTILPGVTSRRRRSSVGGHESVKRDFDESIHKKVRVSDLM